MRNTAWYIKQSKRLDAVTKDLRVGNPLKHRERLRKVDVMKDAVNLLQVGGNFEGHQLYTRYQESATALLELFRVALINQFNKVHYGYTNT
jgi:hypothetical protein